MKKSFWITTLVVGACAVTLSSCLKKSDPQPNNNAYLTVLQASPDAPAMNLFLNNENFFTSVIKYEQWASQRPLVGAPYEMSFREASSGDELASAVTDSLAVGWWYTLIAYDSAASIKAMLFRNTVSTGATTAQALVRFLQLSPDITDPVDLYIDTTRLFATRTFADNRYEPELVEYQGITPGQYDITAINAVTGDTLGAISGQDLTLMNTVFYTFYLRGLTSRTDSAKLELGYLPEGGF